MSNSFSPYLEVTKKTFEELEKRDISTAAEQISTMLLGVAVVCQEADIPFAKIGTIFGNAGVLRLGLEEREFLGLPAE